MQSKSFASHPFLFELTFGIAAAAPHRHRAARIPGATFINDLTTEVTIHQLPE